MLSAPATRAVIYSAAPLPFPADAGTPRHTGPRRLIASLPAAGATQAGLRRPGPLKTTASCGRTVWPACHAHCLWSGCPDPGPPPDPQCARQAGLASFTPHPSLRSFVQFGGVAAHPPPGERWPPPSQGAALRGRAASAAQQSATSSLPDTEAHRPHRRRRRRPRPHRPSARPQADSDHAASRARSQPGARNADG